MQIVIVFFLEQLKQFEEKKITAEELMDMVLNSSTQAPDSEQLLPGDLVMVMKAMNTAVSNMNAKQRMTAAKVNKRSAFVLFRSVSYTICHFFLCVNP